MHAQSPSLSLVKKEHEAFFTKPKQRQHKIITTKLLHLSKHRKRQVSKKKGQELKRQGCLKSCLKKCLIVLPTYGHRYSGCSAILSGVEAFEAHDAWCEHGPDPLRQSPGLVPDYPDRTGGNSEEEEEEEEEEEK